MSSEDAFPTRTLRGRVARLRPLLFGQAEIVVGPAGDNFGYDEQFMYATWARAKRAFEEWSLFHGTEPEGWTRHMPSGRRQTQEEVHG